MNARLIAFLGNLRGSYWFVPTLMTLGAVVLAFVTTALDTRLGADWIENVPWLYANKPDGARALLSTVAGSMITVAGVTFSITISTVVYASSQLGPRLLTAFMEDRGNQITLGTFIATFLYCLLVLRTVRSSDEGGGFVPHFAILCGLALALASLGVLIYFIHHTPATMHVSNMTARIGRELHERVDSLFPEKLGEACPPEDTDLPPNFFAEAARVRAEHDGYIQAVDDDVLLEVATENDLILRVEFRPGDYLTCGQPFVLAWPPDHLGETDRAALEDAFAFGRQRTSTQDVLFLVNELVEVAARALSPGVNDPFTAIGCMDWLGGALIRLGRRAIPEAARRDDDGELRVLVHPITFEVFAGAICDQLRPYARSDRNAGLHMLKMLGEVLSSLDDPERRAVVLRHARELVADAHALGLPQNDLDDLDERLRVLARLTQPDANPEAVSDRYRWLGGSA